jgi:hypothetical protein
MRIAVFSVASLTDAKPRRASTCLRPSGASLHLGGFDGGSWESLWGRGGDGFKSFDGVLGF